MKGNFHLLVSLLSVTLCLLAVLAEKESLSTRATRAEGVVRCGAEPMRNAVIRLFKGASDDIKDVLATVRTDDMGRFTIEGDTNRYQGTEASLDPHIKLYHKCGDAEGKKGFRRVTLRYPRDFASIGKVARRTFNLGDVNMQFGFPKETRVDSITGLGDS